MAQVIVTGFSSKLFTIRLIILKINGKNIYLVRSTADYFVFDSSVPVEIIACLPLFLAGPVSLFMSFLNYYKKTKITFSLEQLFSSNSILRKALLYCSNSYI